MAVKWLNMLCTVCVRVSSSTTLPRTEVGVVLFFLLMVVVLFFHISCTSSFCCNYQPVHIPYLQSCEREIKQAWVVKCSCV